MDIPTHAELIERYQAFCRRHDMAETRFGREATGEPQLIQSIRTGRSPSLKLLQRVAAFMAEHDARLTPGDIESSPDNGGRNIGPSTSLGTGEADSPRPFATSSPICSEMSAPPPQHPDSPGSSITGERVEWPIGQEAAE